jgi:hypothetical protein
MSETLTDAGTLVDAVQETLERTATYNQNVQVAPAALLWTDEKREWERLLPRLRQAMPQLLTLGKSRV